MEESIKTLKRKYDRELKHIKVILTNKRLQLPLSEWKLLVLQTKESIVGFPEDFFCCDLPPAPVFRAAIEKVFEGFLEDQRLREVQTSFHLKYRGDKGA